jgi:hypothetical protein
MDGEKIGVGVMVVVIFLLAYIALGLNKTARQRHAEVVMLSHLVSLLVDDQVSRHTIAYSNAEIMAARTITMDVGYEYVVIRDGAHGPLPRGEIDNIGEQASLNMENEDF